MELDMDNSYVTDKWVKEVEMNEWAKVCGFDYKSALEWMTLNYTEHLVDNQGRKYRITCHKLYIDGKLENDPFSADRFRNLRLYIPQPVAERSAKWESTAQQLLSSPWVGIDNA